MKKHLVLLLLLLAATLAKAQTTVSIGAGLTRGYLDHKYSLSVFESDRYSGVRQGFGLHVGVEYLHRGLYSMYSDIAYMQSGGKNTPKDQEAAAGWFPAPDKLDANYLSFGTMVLLSPVKRKLELQIGMGPRIDFLMAYKGKEPFLWYINRDDKGIGKINGGLSGLLGLVRTIGKTRIGLRATYCYRMRRLLDIPYTQTSQEIRAGAEGRDQTLMIGLSVGRVF